MKQSFTLHKKRKTDLYDLAIIICLVMLALLIINIIIEQHNSLHIPYTMIALIVFSLIFFVCIVALTFIVIKKDYTTLVDFSPEGISCESKGIFMRWEDVKNINIKSLSVEPCFVISSVKGKIPFSVWGFWKMTPEHIIIEIRKELIPVIEQYWKKPIKKISRYKKVYSYLYLLFTIFAFIMFALLILLLLFYALVYLPGLLA